MPYPPSRPRQIVPWSAVPVGGRPRALPSRAHSHSMRRSQAHDGLLAIRCRGCCCKLAGEPCYWMISLRVSSFRECYYYSEYLQKLLNYKKKGILFFLLLWFTTSRHPSQTRRTVRACDALPLPAWLLQFTVSPGSPNPCLSYSTWYYSTYSKYVFHKICKKIDREIAPTHLFPPREREPTFTDQHRKETATTAVLAVL